MKQELITTGATVEEALENAALELGVEAGELTYEVLVEPKKGLFGLGKVAAKIKVIYTADPGKLALEFVNNLLQNMGADAHAVMEDGEGNQKIIRIDGPDAGMLIGYHGETLDALQYLAGLAANKKSDENDERGYQKILIDIENYREKRAQVLKALARRMAAKVLKYRRSVSLDPMSAYERRIIHSEVQNVKGVTTYSVGQDNNRKVVICLEGTEPKTAKG